MHLDTKKNSFAVRLEYETTMSEIESLVRVEVEQSGRDTTNIVTSVVGERLVGRVTFRVGNQMLSQSSDGNHRIFIHPFMLDLSKAQYQLSDEGHWAVVGLSDEKGVWGEIIFHVVNGKVYVGFYQRNDSPNISMLESPIPLQDVLRETRRTVVDYKNDLIAALKRNGEVLRIQEKELFSDYWLLFIPLE